jgi:hypothetical protein
MSLSEGMKLDVDGGATVAIRVGPDRAQMSQDAHARLSRSS